MIEEVLDGPVHLVCAVRRPHTLRFDDGVAEAAVHTPTRAHCHQPPFVSDTWKPKILSNTASIVVKLPQSLDQLRRWTDRLCVVTIESAAGYPTGDVRHAVGAKLAEPTDAPESATDTQKDRAELVPATAANAPERVVRDPREHHPEDDACVACWVAQAVSTARHRRHRCDRAAGDSGHSARGGGAG